LKGHFVQLEMPSKEIRRVPAECFATIGRVSHPEHRFEKKGKAGSRRLKGRRPTVRGSAMNPPDHPHGGGEGRTGIGLKHPKDAWETSIRSEDQKEPMDKKMIIRRRRP